jgi:hypothetical protein
MVSVVKALTRRTGEPRDRHLSRIEALPGAVLIMRRIWLDNCWRGLLAGTSPAARQRRLDDVWHTGREGCAAAGIALSIGSRAQAAAARSGSARRGRT